MNAIKAKTESKTTFISFHFIKLTLILIFMRKIYVLFFAFLLLLLHPKKAM